MAADAVAGGEPEVTTRAWVAVIGGAVGCFMAGMNVHVTNASLPDIRGTLGATFEEGSWITTAYLVAEIIIIPLTAWLGMIFSIRRVLLVGTTGFVIFSICCSLAPNIDTMILARTLQGAFGGVLIPLSFHLIVTELPKSKHPLGMALFAISNNVAQTAGPSIGGWLTDAYSWRWIFYLQIAPGLALLAAIAWSIDAEPMKLDKLREGDWWGILSMAAGLSGLQIMLEEGEQKDWFSSPLIVWSAAAALIGIVAFVIIELTCEKPFINLRLLRGYNFGLASLMQFFFGAVVFAAIYLVPNYFSQVHGYNARDIGLMMIPYGVIQLFMSFATPTLLRWTSARTVIVAGFVFMIAGCWMNIHLDMNSTENVIVPSLIVRGIGQSLIVVALGAMAIDGLDRANVGSASGLFSMVRNVGGAIGIAVASVVVIDRAKLHAVRIGEAVNIFSDETRERMLYLVRLLAHSHLDRTTALTSEATAPLRQRALGMMDAVVQRQALLMAYGDAFLVGGVAMMLCAVGSLLLRSNKRKDAALELPADGH